MPTQTKNNSKKKPQKKHRTISHKLKYALLYLVLAYFACLALLYFSQHGLLYVPDENPPELTDNIKAAGYQTIHYESEEGLTLTTWFRPPETTDNRIFILFHGNAGHIASRAFKLTPFMRQGDGVLLAAYRGYGGNQGRPSEVGLKQDAMAAVAYIKNLYPEHRFIAYGESLGTAMASYVAQHHDFEAVILEAPFDAIYKVAKERYPFFPIRPLMHDRYETDRIIENITAPIIILHGKKDRTVSYKRGLSLFKQAPYNPKIFLSFDKAGHNDLWNHGVGEKLTDIMAHLPFQIEEITIQSAHKELVPFQVEWVSDMAGLKIGMMHRHYLPENKGMMFIFDNTTPADSAERTISMWMENTPSPLDMIFIAKDGTILKIFEDTQPYSREIKKHAGPIAAVLELPAGHVKKHGLKEGAKVFHDFFTEIAP